MYTKFLMLFVFVAILSGVTYAYTDPPPEVTISADKTLVDTSVNIHVFARDSGFFFGLVSITLKEDGNAIETKYCNGFEECTLDKNIQHMEKDTHSYSAAVKDRGGNVKIESVYVKFKGATPPPLLTFEEKPYAEESKRTTVRIYAYDFNNKPLNVTTSKLPRGATFNNGVFEWTPDFDQAGSYTITFSAVDSKNQRISRTMSIDVQDVNRPPVVSAVEPSQTNFAINEDSSLFFRLNITDPDNDHPSVEWLLDGKIVSSSNPFTYKTKFNSAGTHVLVARVEDGAFLQRFIWNITVGDVNRAPVLSHIENREVTVGDKVRFTVRAKDPDSDYLIYEAVKLPYGSTFDPDTGIFEWLTRDRGIYEALFRVHDSKGYYDSAGVEITVLEKTQTDLERYEEAYRKMLENEAKRKKELDAFYAQQKQQKRQNIIRLFNQSFPTEPVCDAGYLCYVISYFVR